MSKVGKLPVAVPAGVTVTTNDGVITVKGPKGELKQSYSENVSVEFKDGQITVAPKENTKAANSSH